MKQVLDYLETKNIKYEIIHHKPAMTTEEADKYIEGKEGVRSKTIFMTNKKDKKFYLIIMDDSKRLDIKKMNELTNDKLHFAKEKQLIEKLGLKPGTVSIFGLINNKDHDINIYIDKDIINEKLITFHPNDNTATIFISLQDMFKILDDLDYSYEVISL